MRRLLAFAAVCALAASASGHGGSYRHGPPTDVPPDSREPSEPPPPPSPASANCRAPGPAKATAWNDWPRWWGFNQDEILGLRRSLRLARRRPTSSAFGRRADEDLRAVTAETVRTRIAPALRGFLADEATSFHVRSSAALALAKCGDDSVVPELKMLTLDEKRTELREVQETAALAFGLLGRADAATRAFLADVVRRRDFDGTFARPFAAVSLGLLGDDDERRSTTALLEVVERKEPGADVKPACLLALGLVGDDATAAGLLASIHRSAAPESGFDGLSQVETSYAVAALGMIGGRATSVVEGDDAVLDALVELVERRHAAPGFDVRRSAAIALGRIAPSRAAAAQRRIVAVLRTLAEDGGADELERNFALTSLGRLASSSTADAAVRADVVEFLGRTMRLSRGTAAPYAAIALGLVGRAVVDAGGAAPEDEIRAPLRERFLDFGYAPARGAFALASGLVRDPLAGDALLKTLRDAQADKRLRGWCALALGMIGDARAADVARATLSAECDRELRIQCATTLGLLGDPRVVDELLEMLRDRDASNYELGSAALALGRIGDERAVDALLEIAVDKAQRFPDLTRALAVVALGEMGDRGDVPALARIATDVNYRAQVPAIAELLTIL